MAVKKQKQLQYGNSEVQQQLKTSHVTIQSKSKLEHSSPVAELTDLSVELLDALNVGLEALVQVFNGGHLGLLVVVLLHPVKQCQVHDSPAITSLLNRLIRN